VKNVLFNQRQSSQDQGIRAEPACPFFGKPLDPISAKNEAHAQFSLVDDFRSANPLNGWCIPTAITQPTPH
jgi:hypothetical protein